jgi:hypothetical protein
METLPLVEVITDAVVSKIGGSIRMWLPEFRVTAPLSLMIEDPAMHRV